MNALDLYEYDGTMGIRTPQSGTQTPSKTEGTSEGQAQEGEPTSPSLNDEVNQVMGQLGKLWGGFRKQSATAFEAARKEVGQVVTTAQKELGKRLETPASPTREDQVTTPTQEDASISAAASTSTSSTEPLAESSSSISQRANQLFSRLQSTLPPNLSENFQKRLHDAQENSTIQQMRSTVTSGLTRLQEQTKGMSLAQAEEFVQQRSEALIKEAGDFFKDAVKILPPEDDTAMTETAIWDGSDSWMVTSDSATSQDSKDKGPSGTFAGNRTAALMHKLRTDSGVLLLEPMDDPSASVKAMYEKWKGDSVSTKGEMSSDGWSEDRKIALSEDGGSLSTLHDQLVPSQMSEEAFWERYFFRVHQIGEDEQRRKALFDETAATEKEEDFSWEDEEEEKMSTTTLRVDQTAKEGSETKITPVPPAPAPARAPTSPRVSEDSYDHVSQTSGMPSRTSPSASVVGSEARSHAPAVRERKADGDDGDSDWE